MAQNVRSPGLGLLVFCILLYPAMTTAQQPASNLVPRRESAQHGTGSLAVDPALSVGFAGYTGPRVERPPQRFFQQLAHQTALPLSLKPSKTAKATLVIQTDHAGKEIQEVGEDESYILDVSTASARLRASTPLGTMHGLQTLLQLVDVSPGGFAAPVVTIQDRPRFPWRGLMIDSARHFLPLDVIRRNIDGMEAVKMNVFHWHLSENQGFRVESKKFPKLHELGSDALYYTQDEIRDLIAYARDRGIRVVPEFDMPGHSTAWFVGHPELASGKGPYEIERRWGIFEPAMDPTNERVYKFLDELIGEMAKVFPDHYFHIGGDEVNGREWDANPKIQAFMKVHGLKNNEALQAYFSGRVQKPVTKHGKAVVGWDEVLVAGVPRDVVIQSWRGQASLARAAKQGYRGILSNGCDLDLEWLGLTHRTVSRHMLQRLAGSASPAEFAALRTLADVIEPVKDYTREQTAPAEPTSATPMNRVVDAVPLESDAGRRFVEMVDQFVASACHDPASEARLRSQLTIWRDNDSILQPLAQRSFLVKEVAANSQDLSALGTMGLAALDSIATGQPAPDSWKAQQLAILEQIKKPKAQLLLIPAPAVQKLVEGVAAGGACSIAKP